MTKTGVFDDTHWLLEQWGFWRMVGMGVPRYVSPMNALIRDNVENVGGVSLSISDELAMAIDASIARMIARERARPASNKGPTIGDCIWLYFGAKWPAMRIGRHYGISEAKTRELIKVGVAWVDSSLENLRETA